MSRSRKTKIIYNFSFDRMSKEEIEDIISNGIIKAEKKIESEKLSRTDNVEYSTFQKLIYFIFKPNKLSNQDILPLFVNSTLSLILKICAIALFSFTVTYCFLPLFNKEIATSVPMFISSIVLAALFFMASRIISILSYSIENNKYSTEVILSFMSMLIAAISLVVSIINKS